MNIELPKGYFITKATLVFRAASATYVCVRPISSGATRHSPTFPSVWMFAYQPESQRRKDDNTKCAIMLLSFAVMPCPLAELDFNLSREGFKHSSSSSSMVESKCMRNFSFPTSIACLSRQAENRNPNLLLNSTCTRVTSLIDHRGRPAIKIINMNLRSLYILTVHTRQARKLHARNAEKHSMDSVLLKPPLFLANGQHYCSYLEVSIGNKSRHQSWELRGPSVIHALRKGTTPNNSDLVESKLSRTAKQWHAFVGKRLRECMILVLSPTTITSHLRPRSRTKRKTYLLPVFVSIHVCFS